MFKTKTIRTLALVVLLVSATLLGRTAVTGTATEPAPAKGPALALGAELEVEVVINEVMPIASAGGFEWIELRAAHGPAAFLPIVYRAFGGDPTPGAASSRSGVQSTQGGAADISGWEIVDGGGSSYVLPAELPSLPPGALIVIHFDGQGDGANDYDLSDGVAELHTPPGLVDVLDNDADQVALYDSVGAIRDFCAYGAPAGEGDAEAVAAGLWTDEAYTGPTVQIPGGHVLTEGGSIGLYPGEDNNSAWDWVICGPGETTPGAANRSPAPYFRNPPDGIATTERRMAFGWSPLEGALEYQFQLAADAGFSEPLIDEYVVLSQYTPESDLADGIYFYRARVQSADGQWSDWSAVGELTVFTVHGGAGVQAVVNLGVTPQLQHKDSRMLCLAGHRRDGDDRWDSAHEDDGDWIAGNGNAMRTNPHDSMYCTRASISMIIDFYGGDLSQDRISYYKYDDATPEDELGHGIGLWPDEMCTWGSGVAGDDDVFTWAINGAGLDCDRGKPTFAEVRAYIDAGRPVLIVENNDQHSVVMDGYDTDGSLAHRVDPWTGTAGWVSWSTWNISEWHAPELVASPRSDEANFWTDGDGDGITDFDEIHRFDTSPNDPDSDDDWVNDKWDLHETYFNDLGAYAPKAAGPDADGDGLRKEVDPDNDGGGTVDGCEDSDYDGRRDGGETWNFSAADDAACQPAFEIRTPTTTSPGEAGEKSSPDKLMIRVLAGIPPTAGTLTLDASDFDVEIEGDAAPLVSAPYAVGDEYWLFVQPPAQTSAGYYDLRVTLQGTQTDTETNAVHYSDQPRDPVDEMLVVDNSGSMSAHDKMVSAKNAARAFVDRWQEHDMVGLVAFSTTVEIPLPLTEVTGTATLADARTAINSMTDLPPSNWYTAIGGGLLDAKRELDGSGSANNQSIVLLSDGMENVDPEWQDAGSGVQAAFTGCDIKVYTVAIGPSDASWRWLLEEISENACNGDGEAWHTSGGESSPTGTAIQFAGFPSHLSNRLADIYLSIAEADARDQRLWEATGTVNYEVYEKHKVVLPKGLPEAIWTVNWGEGMVGVELYDPDGNQIKPGMPGVSIIQDDSHEQIRISTPMDGAWQLWLSSEGKPQYVEYLAVLSAHSPVQMWLLLGLPPKERLVGAQMPVHVVLADHKPIPNAVVSATVMAPDIEYSKQLELYDDGKHGDGEADDGLYGNLFDIALPGSYTVKAWSAGVDNQGEPFERYATRSFYVRPRVAYIYDASHPNGLPTAYGYQKLLQANGFVVDLLDLYGIASDADWSRYEYAIVGPYTGSGASWGTPDALVALQYVPVLGLGEGGYDYFGERGLSIGAPNGWHGTQTSLYAYDTSHEVWSDPYPIPMPRTRIVQVYEETGHVGIHILKPDSSVTLIGREEVDQNHYILLEDSQYPGALLWGFSGPPADMTATGRDLFVNTAWHMQ